MEQVTGALKALEYFFKLCKKLEGYVMRLPFRKFKLNKVEEFMVFPEDADIGQERRIVFGIEFAVKTGKFDEPISLKSVEIQIPRTKRDSFPWKLFPETRTVRWKDWRVFKAITPYEVEKHSGELMRWLYELESFFPKKEGEIFRIESSREYTFFVAFDVKHVSPYRKPVKLVFRDNFDEVITVKEVFLEP